MKKIFISFIVATTLAPFHTGYSMQDQVVNEQEEALAQARVAAIRTHYANDCKNDRNNNTLLHFTALNNDYDNTVVLCDNLFDVDATNFYGDTPLHLAARHGFTAIVEVLLTCDDTNRNPQNKFKETPLHAAIPQTVGVSLQEVSAFCEIIKCLLNSGANPNIADSRGQTPLHNAVLFGYEREALVAELLADEHTNVNCMNNHGRTPLDFALQNKNKTIARMLLKHNASIGLKTTKEELDYLQEIVHEVGPKHICKPMPAQNTPSLASLIAAFGHYGPLMLLNGKDESE